MQGEVETKQVTEQESSTPSSGTAALHGAAPTDAEKSNSLHQLVVAEVAGKNTAIHAYDDIIWKIRTGYLTLLFAGWAILLKSIAERDPHSGRGFGIIVAAMVLFSLGLALSGWLVDLTYIRQKHRVILTLNRLTDAICDSDGDLHKVAKELLRNAGENPGVEYKGVGYKEAVRDATAIFFLPVVTLALSGSVLIA